VIVGGVLSSGSDYTALATALSGHYQVHVMERRGRPGSGPQRADHSIEAECADLAAVAAATGSRSAFGHSLGGLIVLETARRQPIFDNLFVYEAGVPVRGQLMARWLDGYQHLLESGDRRGAFAWMVKHNGYAPRPIGSMPMRCVRLMLRLGIRGAKWAHTNQQLESNLVEHRLQASLDAPSAQRFSTINARTVLLAGAKSPQTLSGPLLHELAEVIPNSTVAVIPGVGHAAPQAHPGQIAGAVLFATSDLKS
jgi:pimeloyl-ACP methyl ester carboxylesterase